MSSNEIKASGEMEQEKGMLFSLFHSKSLDDSLTNDPNIVPSEHICSNSLLPAANACFSSFPYLKVCYNFKKNQKKNYSLRKRKIRNGIKKRWRNRFIFFSYRRAKGGCYKNWKVLGIAGTKSTRNWKEMQNAIGGKSVIDLSCILFHEICIADALEYVSVSKSDFGLTIRRLWSIEMDNIFKFVRNEELSSRRF